MKKLLILLVLFSQGLLAQSKDELFEQGNELYKLEKYTEAIASYIKIEETGFTSSELYYNLGNCYYKLNKVAPAIYNYEKALLINPFNEDAQNNLIFAKRLTIDNIEAIPISIFQKLDNTFVKKLSYNEWAMVSVTFSIIAALLFLLFYFSYSPSKKRLFFVTSTISFLLLIISAVFTIKEYSNYNSTIEAIIFVEETDIKNAPTLNSEKVFTLHEGTKVLVLDTVDNWKKIKISDGKIGWIIADEIKILTLL